jgi:hypothetical protein
LVSSPLTIAYKRTEHIANHYSTGKHGRAAHTYPSSLSNSKTAHGPLHLTQAVIDASFLARTP